MRKNYAVVDARVVIEKALSGIKNPLDRTIFELVGIGDIPREQAGSYLGLSEHEVLERYNHVWQHILVYLKKSGSPIF